jgi:hypothetical protein
LRAFFRPTFRRRRVVRGFFPAIFLRQAFDARVNALRAAFGVVNLMRFICATTHFLYPRFPPTTRRLFTDFRLRTIVCLLFLGDEQTIRLSTNIQAIVFHRDLYWSERYIKVIEKSFDYLHFLIASFRHR